MKSTMLKIKILAVMAIISFSFTSCSDDGDEGAMSFLEKHGDTVYKFFEPTTQSTIYGQINDSETNPFELWASLFDVCYIHQSLEDLGSPEVLESSEDRIVFRVDESATEYSILTLTVLGNVLTFESEYYEDGVLEEDDIFVLQETDDNIDNLELCDDI